tara:strand:- start:48 stop:212 length:165 start_codon:yes stop_codon:yes gene_type:complete
MPVVGETVIGPQAAWAVLLLAQRITAKMEHTALVEAGDVTARLEMMAVPVAMES